MTAIKYKDKLTNVNCKSIFVLCYLAYTAIYVARLNLSIASPELISQGIADKAQIGFMGGAFSVVYAIGRLINGGIGDRAKPYIMIATGLLFVGLSNILIGWLPVYYVMVVLWGINALAQSMLWSSILKVISSVYDSEKAKKVTPYMVTSVATGNILGIVINTYLINHFGMEYAFIIPGASALVFCALSAIQMRKIENLSPVKEQKSIFSVLKDANVRKCVLPAVFHGVIKDNISLWMAVYIIETFGVDLSKSSYYILLIPVIGFLGRLLYPTIYRICRYREHLVSQIGFVICILAILPISVAKTSALIAAACLSIEYAAISLINTTLLSIFPMQYAESNNVSSVSGIMDFATYLGAGIGSAIYGYMIVNFGFSSMFISWGILSILSIVILCCKRRD